MQGLTGVIDKKCTPTAEIIDDLCRTQPLLGFAIFQRDTGNGVVDKWTFDPKDGSEPASLYLYDCHKIRASSPSR